MVLVHCTSSHCNLSIFFHFNRICTFQDIALTSNHYEKLYRGDNTVTINIQGGLWFLCAALPLTAIYL